MGAVFVKDWSNKRIGKLTAILQRENGKWAWACDCGEIVVKTPNEISSWTYKACHKCCRIKNEDHRAHDPQFILYPGLTLGFWTLLEEGSRNAVGRKRWLCSCVCGNVRFITRQGLRIGIPKSCGCRSYGPHKKKPKPSQRPLPMPSGAPEQPLKHPSLPLHHD